MSSPTCAHSIYSEARTSCKSQPREVTSSSTCEPTEPTPGICLKLMHEIRETVLQQMRSGLTADCCSQRTDENCYRAARNQSQLNLPRSYMHWWRDNNTSADEDMSHATAESLDPLNFLDLCSDTSWSSALGAFVYLEVLAEGLHRVGVVVVIDGDVVTEDLQLGFGERHHTVLCLSKHCIALL